MLVSAIAGDDAGGVSFVAHATRFDRYMDIRMNHLRSWLPGNTMDCDVKRWAGSSAEERESAQGLQGLFHSVSEVEDFVAGLSGVLSKQSHAVEERSA